MNELQIESRTIGPNQPVCVIAELGVNHDGSVQRALELVTAAAGCGADAVKIQVFRATILLHASAGLAEYQKNTRADSPIDLLRKLELSADDARRVVQRIRELKMIPLATPFSPVDVETIEQLRLPAIKIASPDLVNRPLLERAAATRKPLLISTGAAAIEEVETSVRWLKEWNARFMLLHCVSAYPTPNDQANLCWISELSRRLECPIGYSDHTTSPFTGGFAVAAGACVIERHLTYDKSAKGPDHATSSDPREFERYVKLIREAQILRGTTGKKVLDIEQDVRKVSRQSLVARRTLKPGDTIRPEDLTVQRPGTGLPAAMITQTVGRRVIKPVSAGALLQWDMLDAA